MRYAFASLGSGLFLTAIPVILYVIAMFVSDDMGGPLNLVIIPLGSAIIGFTISILILLPLGILRVRFSLSYLQVALILSFCFILLFATPAIWFYGFHAQAKTPIPRLCMILGVVMTYSLLGLLVHFLCYSTYLRFYPTHNATESKNGA
jgi:hypothetical protein